MTSVRLLISLAARYSWPLYQMDVKNAFLNGTLYEEVYMEQPPGYVAQGESANMVCRLRPSLFCTCSHQHNVAILHHARLPL